jgi:hypothetical protein
MVKPLHLAIGAMAIGASWWFFRGRIAPAAQQKPAPVDISISQPEASSGGSNSTILSILDNLLNPVNLLPVTSVQPNNTGGSVAVSPGIVAPVVAPIVVSPLPAIASVQPGDKNPYAGNPMFDPVIQAYSTAFAEHNANGGGFAWVNSVGGPEGFRAGNR